MLVYMVHGEVGEYSDWTYKVEGIFSSYTAAKVYLESKTLGVWLHTKQAVNEYRGNAGLYQTDAIYGLPLWRTSPLNGVDMKHVEATLVSDDGWSFYYTVAGSTYYVGGDGVWEYFITEYEVDKVVE